MNVLFGEDEIKNFPVEIRNFLKSYLIERLESDVLDINIKRARLAFQNLWS